MQTDKTTKTLLFLIAVALWGLLLKPAVDPLPSHAQANLVTPVRIVAVDGGSLPVTLQRQMVPLEIKPVAAGSLPVQITGQQGVLQVRTSP